MLDELCKQCIKDALKVDCATPCMEYSYINRPRMIDECPLTKDFLHNLFTNILPQVKQEYKNKD